MSSLFVLINRDCPEEAMEAVSTLIFAAARFADLPELCDLRSLFAKRYGNCMESSVNPEVRFFFSVAILSHSLNIINFLAVC